MAQTQIGYPKRTDYGVPALIAAIACGQIVALLALSQFAQLTAVCFTIAIFTVFALVSRGGKVYVLIAVTTIAPNFLGFAVPFPGATVNDLLPLYPWFAFVSVLALLVGRMAKTRDYDFATPFNGLVAAFFFWAALSVIWSPNYGHALFELIHLFANVIIFYIAAAVLRDTVCHSHAISAYIVWGLAVAALSMISLHFLDESFYWSPELTDTLTFEFAFKNSPFRAKAITNPNTTALILNLALAFLICNFAWAKGREHKLWRIVQFLGILFLVYGVMETKSKAGLGAMFVMVAFLIFATQNLRKRLITNLVTAVAIFLILFLAQTAALGLTPRVLATEEMSATSRTNIWSLGLDLLFERSHGWGLGIGGLTHYADPLPHAHSVYFSTLFDLGPVGFSILAILYVSLAIRVLRRLPHQQSFAQVMLVASAAGFVAISIQGLVDASYMVPILWLYMGVTVATLALVEKELVSTTS